jgi:DNA-directed RNA polymerase specialized sigma24 family protein
MAGCFDDGIPESFEGLIELVRSRLLPALWAKWGVEVGNDICAEVEEYVWTHHAELLGMTNPMGYLFRVSQSKSRRYLSWLKRNTFPGHLAEIGCEDRELNDSLRDLAILTVNQRACVLLVHGFGWSYAEVAELLSIKETAVNNHVNRGLVRLRAKASSPTLSSIEFEPWSEREKFV